MRTSLTLLLLLCSVSSSALAAAPPFACKAIHRSVNEAKESVERTLPLREIFRDASLAKYAVDFAGKYFSLNEDILTGDVLAQITAEPDYTKGTVFRGAADSKGYFNATEVIEYTVYRLECRRAAQ